jgi:hypothetical protein
MAASLLRVKICFFWGGWWGAPEGHAGELAVEDGQHLADGLGGTSGGGDDVVGCTTASTPVLHPASFSAL